MSIYDFSVKAQDGSEVNLSEYKGKVLLVVNTATGCGFTPQYDALQDLYDEFKDSGLEILDFPCNQFGEQAPGSDEEIHSFCTGRYGITFPQFAKIDVNGENAITLYKWLTENTKLAEAIGRAVKAEVQDVSVPLNEKADVLFLGCSYYAFDVADEIKTFIEENKDKIGKVVCFGTSAMMKSVYKPMSKVTGAAGIEMHPKDFHCRGSFGPAHKGRPNEEDIENAVRFAKEVIGE